MTTILVVDDHAADRKLLALVLEAEQYAVLQAGDGADALSVLERHAADLVITDIQMRPMDGCELIRHLRGTPRLAHMPVIFYTATYRDQAARQLAAECGADDILSKPSPTAEILASIQRSLDSSAPAREDDPVDEQQWVRADERARIARRLHDEVAQLLAGLQLHIHGYKANPPATEIEVSAALAIISARVQEASRVVRRIARDLRPALMERYGLMTGVRRMVRDLHHRTGLRIGLNGEVPHLPPEHADTVYFIIQEGLLNATRHAGANEVMVTLHQESELLTVTISDDGRGVSAQMPTGSGLGLTGMRERAESTGGNMAIAARQPFGTTITVRLPFGAAPATE